MDSRGLCSGPRAVASATAPGRGLRFVPDLESGPTPLAGRPGLRVTEPGTSGPQPPGTASRDAGGHSGWRRARQDRDLVNIMIMVIAGPRQGLTGRLSVQVKVKSEPASLRHGPWLAKFFHPTLLQSSFILPLCCHISFQLLFCQELDDLS